MPKEKPAAKKITVHLGKHNVQFEVVKHRKVYTAYDLAQTMGEKLENVAKTLLVRVELPSVSKKPESKYYTVVLPASYSVDLGKLKKALGAKKLELVLEKGMLKIGMEPGALTPFGSVRGFATVVDKALLKSKQALMGAESFTEHLRLNVKDFVKAEQPLVVSFGKKNSLKLQVKPGKLAKKKGGMQRPAKKAPKKAVKKPATKKAAQKKKAAPKKAAAQKKSRR